MVAMIFTPSAPGGSVGALGLVCWGWKDILGDVEVSLVPDLVDEALHEGPVLVRGRRGAGDVGANKSFDALLKGGN